METMGLSIPSTSEALRHNFTVLHRLLYRQLANERSANALRWELTKLRTAIVKSMFDLRFGMVHAFVYYSAEHGSAAKSWNPSGVRIENIYTSAAFIKYITQEAANSLQYIIAARNSWDESVLPLWRNLRDLVEIFIKNLEITQLQASSGWMGFILQYLWPSEVPDLSQFLPLVNSQLDFSQRMAAHMESMESHVQQLANLRPEDAPRLGLNESNLAALKAARETSVTNLSRMRQSIDDIVVTLNDLVPIINVRSTAQRDGLSINFSFSTGLISTSRDRQDICLSFHVSMILINKSLWHTSVSLWLG